MYRLKSLFIMPYMGAMMLLTIYSLYRLLGANPSLGWAGVLLVSGPFMLWLSRVMLLRDQARTSANLPLITALGALGVAFAAYGYWARQSGVVPLVLALAGFGLYLLYDYWYSRFGRQFNAGIGVGAPLPEFSVQSLDGSTVQSTSFRGHPTLILFFRGNWCPLCMAQIREIAGEYAELAKAGVNIVLISPQSHEQTQTLAQRFDVPFQFLVDANNEAARRLGIEARGGVPAGMPGYAPDTVLPTVIITDANGTIIFSDQTDNYRVRPEPATFRRELAKAGILAPG